MMHIMPWTDEHKERTRERIVQAAAAALRARGVDGVSIAEIMAEAGLTHGGFYAHFGSKDDLLRAALDAANGQTLDMLSGATQSTSPDQRIGAVVDAYLSPKHAAHPERGCPLAALGPELARAPGKVRHALSLGVERRLEWLERFLPGNGHDDEEATALLACMVGGLILARAVAPERSDAVLDATRAFVRRGLGGSRGKRRTAREHGARPRSSPRRRKGRST
jgi:TetR/AcrR family transcriptional regulator, transcriptional repressor for nem operon